MNQSMHPEGTLKDLEAQFTELDKYVSLNPSLDTATIQSLAASLGRLEQALASRASFLGPYNLARFRRILESGNRLLPVQPVSNAVTFAVAGKAADARLEGSSSANPYVANSNTDQNAGATLVASNDLCLCIDEHYDLNHLDRNALLHKAIRVYGLAGKSLSLPAPMKSLHLQKLAACTISAGPCAGPVYLEDCVDCTIRVAGHQIRNLCVSNCALHLYSGTSVVLEECANNQLSQYNVEYAEVCNDFKSCGLDRNCDQSSNIVDFDNP